MTVSVQASKSPIIRRQDFPGATSQFVIHGACEIARGFFERGFFEEAESLYLREVGLLAGEAEPDAGGIAYVLTRMSGVLIREGRGDEARDALERSSAIVKRSDVPSISVLAALDILLVEVSRSKGARARRDDMGGRVAGPRSRYRRIAYDGPHAARTSGLLQDHVGPGAWFERAEPLLLEWLEDADQDLVARMIADVRSLIDELRRLLVRR